MGIDDAWAGSVKIAESLQECMRAVHRTHPNLEGVYGVCLAVLDDFSSMSLFLNTDAYLAKKGGTISKKWDVYGWWSDGMDIDTKPLINAIGEVQDFDSTPENDLGPLWLAALTNSMLLAKNKNAFVSGGEQPYLFCTITDSANTHWLEYRSAESLNSEVMFSEFANEVAEAHYCRGNPLETGRTPFRIAYENAMQQIKHFN